MESRNDCECSTCSIMFVFNCFCSLFLCFTFARRPLTFKGVVGMCNQAHVAIPLCISVYGIKVKQNLVKLENGATLACVKYMNAKGIVFYHLLPSSEQNSNNI